MTRKAEFVMDLKGFTGLAKLYRINPPVNYGDGKKADFIVASAINAFDAGPETYLFPSDEAGHILDWAELEGSYKGGLDHQEAIDGWIASGEVTP